MAEQATIATAYIQLVPTLTGVQGTIGEALGGGGAEREVEDTGKRFGGKFGAAVAGGIAAAGVAVAAAAKGLFEVGATFDDVADSIQVATGKTGGALDEMVGQAKNIGKSIPVEFDKIGPALSTVSNRLNLTGSDLETVTSQFLALGNMGQDLNLDQATAAFSAFGVKGADVSGQLDALFKIGQQTGVGIDSITAAVQKSAPALQQLGFSFQDSAAMVAQLDKAGLNSQQVLAGMGKGLVALAKQGEKPQAAFQRISGNVADLVAQGKDAEAIDMASGLFGTKGAAQFVEATKNGSLNVQEMTASLGDAQGSILQTQSDTSDFAEQWLLAKNNLLSFLEPMGSAVFGVVGTAMGKINEQLGPMLDSFTALGKMMASGDFQGGIFGLEEDSPIIGGLLSVRDVAKDAFGGLMDTFGQLGSILGPALVDVFNQLWPVLKEIGPQVWELVHAFSPVSLIFKVIQPLLPQIAQLAADLARQLGGVLASALQVVAPILSKLTEVINRLVPFITQLVARLLPVFGQILGQIAPALQKVLDALMPLVDTVMDLVFSLVDALMPAFMGLLDTLMPIVMRVFTYISDTVGNAITVFQGVVDFITGVFTGDWQRAWDGVLAIFSGIWSQFTNIFNTLWDIASAFFTTLIPRIWDLLFAASSWLWEKGKELISWLFGGIVQGAQSLWDWFTALPGEVWNRVLAFASWVVERGKEFLTWLWDGIKNKAEELWTWFTNLPGVVWDKIVTSMSTVIAHGSEFIGWLITGITDGIKSLWTWLSGGIDDPNSFIGGVWAAILTIKDKVLQIGKDFVGWIISGIGEVAGSIWTAITDAFTGSAESFAQDPLYGASGANRLGKAGGGLVAKAAGGPMGEWQIRPNGRVHGPGGGRDDLIPTMLSNHEFVVNAGSTARYYSELMAINENRYAAGGVVDGFQGTFDAAKTFGSKLAKGLLDLVLEVFKSPVGPANGSAVKSYDPSSFGWVQNANINTGFSWNGTTWPGGVARGTEGLWTSLLNQLVPNIAGGLQPGSQWGYANRTIAGTGTPSFHSYGLALDINASSNGRGLSGYGRAGQYVIPGEVAHRIASSLGMEWGGDWSYTDPMHFEIHLPPSALGATVGSTIGTGGVIGGLVQLIRKKLGLDAAPPGGGYGGALPDAVAGGKFDGLVERWRPTVLQALALTGQAPGFADYVLNQIRSESSGNPSAINDWDSNAKKGTPSKGLVQVIDPTFRSYALPGYDQNIWDPLSNILAGIRYAIARYGSIPKGMRGVAYDDGGWLMPWQQFMPMNLMRQPEPVLTPRQWDIAEAAMTDAVNRANGKVEMTVHQLPGQSAADLAREIDRRLAFAGGRSA